MEMQQASKLTKDFAVPRRRLVIIDSSSSDEDYEPESKEQKMRWTGPQKSDRENNAPDRKKTMVELEVDFKALRMTEPIANNGIKPTSTSAVEKPSTNNGDDGWEFDERSNVYILPSHSAPYASDRSTCQWPVLKMPKSLFDQLYDFQKTGVRWMADLHAKGIGGILGDDMGMGKTYTTLAFLGGLLKGGTIKNALIVAPVSVLRSWESEAQKIIKCCVGDVVIRIVSSETSSRSKLLREAFESSYQPHIVITTYGLVSSTPQEFVAVNKRNCCWDYIVLDEAHIIKNHNARVSKNCREIARDENTHLLLLTGTPIMNRLSELWALVDYVTKSRVFPNLPIFLKQFARPIEASRHVDASDSEVRHGERANKELQEMLKDFFLQRLKIDYLKDKLPIKRELVVWTHLSTKQREIYQEYTNFGEPVASILAGEKSSPLEAITWLKKLCGHPLLVDKKADDVSNAVELLDPSQLVEQSAKLGILASLIDRLRQSGHRTLIFSQSTKMLDIIQSVLCNIGVRLGRIDGSTKECDRQRIVDDFNSLESRTEALLLSTKAAGVGLTLTGADRAVIYDPSWNPAEDAQAVDRCYRIGQKNEVTVYRFIAAGTVEEKMYEKQIHKDGIRRTVTSDSEKATQRYFKQNETNVLFVLAPPGVCEVLSKVGSKGDQTPLGSSGKPTFLTHHPGVVGVSSHDGLYADDTLPESQKAEARPFEGSVPTTKSLGRSQRALLKPPTAVLKPSTGEKHQNESAGVEKAVERNKPPRLLPKKPIPAGDRTCLQPVSSVAEYFRKVDCLDKRGDLVEGLGILLWMLESLTLTPDEEDDLHLRIATISHKLRWLEVA